MKEYLIDTHAHIDMLEAPIESTLQLMKDFGVKKAVIPSVEVSSMEKVIAAAEADERCEEPLDESRLFQIYASGVYDAALGGRVRCIPGKTL